jgi:mono/diheme cytochrome c family protein
MLGPSGLAAVAATLLPACGGDDDRPLDSAAARGRTVYENVCIACHNADPGQDGSLGPAVAGASLELLEAKVLRGEYPPGYAPRRPGTTMPKYAYLSESIDAIAAYLAGLEPGGE